ncbi:hypothetical protein BDP81DRAFT_452366 [Colletotrichum phormii]|uniref:Uncharacterized protein n=1 Tax=Colletotrichum phormii TaxID=359342 RepID=A0AAI9ZJQ6_9PEZI|nr:uncharacterized protein BDP81DRAFT_452366 [Colletotrichum phormii]KAK1633260.1 hypothetical protein BDP81DRAFT_452366 [Colletotrichum phormii]
MADFSQEELKLFATEVNGEVSDRPMCGIIDVKIRGFYQTIDNGHWNTAAEYLREDAKLVADLAMPGSIHENTNSVVDYYRARYYRLKRTVIKLLVIDRGRATCSLESFWLVDKHRCDVPAMKATTLMRQREVCVIDLDENHLIKRIEYRDTSERISVTKGSRKKMNHAVAESEKDVVVMMEHFGY